MTLKPSLTSPKVLKTEPEWPNGMQFCALCEKARKGTTLALKPRVDVTRSSQKGYQLPHEKDLRSPKIYKN